MHIASANSKGKKQPKMHQLIESDGDDVDESKFLDPYHEYTDDEPQQVMCVCVCVVCVCVCEYTDGDPIHICICICIYIHIYTYTYTYIHTYIHT